MMACRCDAAKIMLDTWIFYELISISAYIVFLRGKLILYDHGAWNCCLANEEGS